MTQPRFSREGKGQRARRQGGLVPARPAADSLCALELALSPLRASVSPDVKEGGSISHVSHLKR